MSVLTVTTLTCDHCGHTAPSAQPMLHLQNVVLADSMYVGTPSAGLSLHACSTKCATELLPRFDEGPCSLCAKVDVAADVEAPAPVPAKPKKKSARR